MTTPNSTVSDERLAEIANFQPLDWGVTHTELTGMARELQSRRSLSTGTDAGVRQIKARISEMEAANAKASSWGAAVGARLEEIRSLKRQLSSLEQHPAASQERKGMSEDELLDLPAHPFAAWKTGLPLGLHRVFWKDGGGSSLVAVGMKSDGRRWFAPCNWVAPSENPEADFWDNIERTELIAKYPEAPTSKGEVSEDMVERACRSAYPSLFSEDAETRHMAASPFTVEHVRTKTADKMRAALTAALTGKGA